MDFASPRQSKLHLISVAQSNQHLVDPLQEAGLELGVEDRPTEDEYNASSYPLSNIQSEIQLQQINRTSSAGNVSERQHVGHKAWPVDHVQQISSSNLNM